MTKNENNYFKWKSVMIARSHACPSTQTVLFLLNINVVIICCINLVDHPHLKLPKIGPAVARVQFPATAEYFKGFFPGWSHSANPCWASVAENGSISPQWHHTTCGQRGGRPKFNQGQTMGDKKNRTVAAFKYKFWAYLICWPTVKWVYLSLFRAGERWKRWGRGVARHLSHTVASTKRLANNHSAQNKIENRMSRLVLIIDVGSVYIEWSMFRWMLQNVLPRLSQSTLKKKSSAFRCIGYAGLPTEFLKIYFDLTILYSRSWLVSGKNWPTLTKRFPMVVIGILSACTGMPHREDNSITY